MRSKNAKSLATGTPYGIAHIVDVERRQWRQRMVTYLLYCATFGTKKPDGTPVKTVFRFSTAAGRDAEYNRAIAKGASAERSTDSCAGGYKLTITAPAIDCHKGYVLAAAEFDALSDAERASRAAVIENRAADMKAAAEKLRDAINSGDEEAAAAAADAALGLL